MSADVLLSGKKHLTPPNRADDDGLRGRVHSAWSSTQKQICSRFIVDLCHKTRQDDLRASAHKF